MRPASKSDAGDADAAAAADFLRRLSVADAKVLLERTRKEKDAKTMEMQKMIGVRYRDLIDSADKIVSMHSAAMRLETSLKEMPTKWKAMDTALSATLSSSEAVLNRITGEYAQAQAQRDGAREPSEISVHARVLFIVTAHETLWFHLDRGETREALALYSRAKGNFESDDVQGAISTYPFLPSMWASVHSFEQRVKSVAEFCLATRGKSASFYAGNLSALAQLNGTHDPDTLVATFLSSRCRWLELDDGDADEEPAKVLVTRARQMRLNLRSLLVTILHAQAIFFSRSEGGSSLSNKFADSAVSDRILQTIEEWYGQRIQEVASHARATINHIPTIAKIAQTQAKLGAIEAQYEDYRSTTLWRTLQGDSHTMVITSMFELLFGNALRKRTRDLVQSSFVDATAAIKSEIRSYLSEQSESSRPMRQLQSIRFYEHFEGIHKKVAGLKSSELHRVLAEEYMRTLAGVVSFLESEYPWSDASDASRDPSFLLCLAHILTSIVSQFSERKQVLFGDEDNSTRSGPSLADDLKAFDRHAQSGKLTRDGLAALLKEHAQLASTSTFMDEDIEELESVGFYTFRLLCQVKAASSFAVIFVDILQGLAQRYCEAWARQLLSQKIAPLRDFLQVEQYDLTNEEWISSHQAWSEHTILDDGSSDEDDADGEPLSAAGEKVWLPWCETPTVSSFLFSCCYALDETYRLVQTASNVSPAHVDAMHDLIRSVLTEQLTIMSVNVYEEAVDLVVKAKQAQPRSVLNFGEYCMLQFLFDMYFVRATLGFSDFVRFGWGDEIDLATCAPSVARLKKLFGRMHDFIDPVDWEIYGPQLIENVVVQFRKSRLLFSSLSEANDISEINGKPIVVSAQDTRPIIKLAEPVPRFSLLPVPATRRRSPSASQLAAAANSARLSMDSSDSLFQETSSTPSLPSLKLQNLLANATSANLLSAATSSSTLLSAATSGTNLLSSAAKGMSFLSSATSSYLREGGGNSETPRSKYF